jgi:hypothetical protein
MVTSDVTISSRFTIDWGHAVTAIAMTSRTVTGPEGWRWLEAREVGLLPRSVAYEGWSLRIGGLTGSACALIVTGADAWTRGVTWSPDFSPSKWRNQPLHIAGRESYRRGPQPLGAGGRRLSSRAHRLDVAAWITARRWGSRCHHSRAHPIQYSALDARRQRTSTAQEAGLSAAFNDQDQGCHPRQAPGRGVPLSRSRRRSWRVARPRTARRAHGRPASAP